MTNPISLFSNEKILVFSLAITFPSGLMPTLIFSLPLDNKSLIYGRSGYEQKGFIVATNNQKRHNEICLQIKEIIEKENILSINF